MTRVRVIRRDAKAELHNDVRCNSPMTEAW